MYVSRVDTDEVVALWVFEESTPEEWDAHLRDLARYIASFKASGRRGASLIIARDFSRPATEHRAELTRLTDLPEFNPFVAFVNPNAALRAVLAMFGWMQKAPRYELDFFGSSAAGLAWLEKKRGTKLPQLSSFHSEVLAEYRQKKGRDLP